jgi:DNA-binding CsgD family transcriptional regulator
MREGFHQRRMTWRPSERQAAVLDALSEGLTNDEIAARIGISPDGVKWHVGELLGRSGLPDRYALAEWWRQQRPRGRAVGFAWPASLRFGFLAGAVAVVGVAAVFVGGLLPGREHNGDVETPQAVQADIGDGEGPPEQAAAAQPPPSGGKPFFAQRQMDYVGTPTVRISGGDLPHPVTVPEIEFEVACANATNNGLSCSAGVDRQNLPEPDPGLPRYRWDFVYIGADYDVPNEWFWYGGREVPSHEYWYVPSEPPVVGPLPDYGWVELGKPVADMIDRYAGLAKVGAINGEPADREGLLASFDHLDGEVAVQEPAGAMRVLPDVEARRLVELLGQMEPVILIGEGPRQRDLNPVIVELRLGSEVLPFLYLPPGEIAEQALIAPSLESLSSWRLWGDRYAKSAFVVPEALEMLMTDLGVASSPPPAGLRSTVVHPQPEHWKFISRIEIWREGEDERLVLPPLDHQPCPEGCNLEYPATEPAGEPLKVAIWPTGVQPFPDLASPALFDYYPDDGTGRGALVQTACPAVAGGHCSQFIDFSFYPPPPIDAILQEAARQLQ